MDLIRAATWTPEFDLQDEIDTLLTVLDRKKYGRVDSKTTLRTIAASAGFGFARDDMQRLRELSPEELQSVVAKAAEVAKRVELDDARQEELRQFADGRVIEDELIQREIGQHLGNRCPLLPARVGLPTQQVSSVTFTDRDLPWVNARVPLSGPLCGSVSP